MPKSLPTSRKNSTSEEKESTHVQPATEIVDSASKRKSISLDTTQNLEEKINFNNQKLETQSETNNSDHVTNAEISKNISKPSEDNSSIEAANSSVNQDPELVQEHAIINQNSSTVPNSEKTVSVPDQVPKSSESNKRSNASEGVVGAPSDVTDHSGIESVEVSKTISADTSVKDESDSNKGDPSNARLEHDLDQEIRYSMTLQNLRQVWELLPAKDPDTVRWSVNVLEQSVSELEDKLNTLNLGKEYEDTEFKLRYEAQMDLNNKLEEQTVWYNTEVLKMKERNKTGEEYSYDADLDDMTEFELAKLVKQLERDRNNLFGDLRSKSWLLDNQSKEYFHHKELIKAYTGDLNHINRSLEHFWRQRSHSRESSHFGDFTTPVTSPGSMKWTNDDSGIHPSQRVIDSRKGPVRKTVGVRSLPRLDPEALDSYEAMFELKKRTKSLGSSRSRIQSMDVRSRRKVSSRPDLCRIRSQSINGDATELST